MSAQFKPWDAVICVDAADIPSPPWTPLVAGRTYIIREVDPIPEIDGNYDKNIHKKAKYLVRLFGVSNPVNPEFGKELAYAETRFEKIEPNADKVESREKIKEVA